MVLSQTVLITGANAGIGYKTAELFAVRGWRVIACTRKGSGYPVHTNIEGMVMDMNDHASIDACLQALSEKGKMPTVLVQNAGFGLQLPFVSMTDSDVKTMFQTNVLGVMHLAQEWLKRRDAKTPGVMMTVGSLAGQVGLLYFNVYCSTKHAVRGWSEALWQELTPHNIAVKLIEPLNRVETDFFRAANKQEEDHPIPENDRARYEAYQAERAHMMRTALSATDVAETIFRAATDGRKKLYYPVSKGIATRALYVVHRIAPSLVNRLLGLVIYSRLK